MKTRMETGQHDLQRAPTGVAGPGPTPEVIARLAQLIWEQEGRPSGTRPEPDFRLRAEAALAGTDQPIPE